MSTPSIATIKRIVAHATGVTVLDIDSRRRTAGVVFPRHVAMYLARHMTEASYPEIGRKFGRRDHTTVMSGVRKVETMIGADDSFAASVAGIALTVFRETGAPNVA